MNPRECAVPPRGFERDFCGIKGKRGRIGAFHALNESGLAPLRSLQLHGTAAVALEAECGFP